MKSFRLFLAGLFVALALPLATSCGGGGGTVTLAAPGGVSIQVGNGFLTISWNTVGGATSYHIYWKVGPGVTKQNSTKITNATRPFTHGGLTNGTNYRYKVVAANLPIESALFVDRCWTMGEASGIAGGGAHLRPPSGWQR